MSGRNGNESFDFSKPFVSSVEVEVVPKTVEQEESKVQTGTFEERFESIKNSQAQSFSGPKKTSTPKKGSKLWALTIFLLVLFCSLVTYTLVNYRSNQIALQDAHRAQSAVAGVKTDVPVRIVGEGYSVASEKNISRDFIYSNKETEKVVGVDRLFNSSSVLIQKNEKKSGIIVLQQEQTKVFTVPEAKKTISSISVGLGFDEKQGEYTGDANTVVWVSQKVADKSFKQVKIIVNPKVIAVVKMLDEVDGYTQDVGALFDGVMMNR